MSTRYPASAATCLFLLLIVCAAPLRAQEAPPGSASGDDDRAVLDSLDLPDVTVTATRLPISAHRAPARVTVLDRDDVEATGALTAAEVIEDRSAVFLKRYGPDGLASISLRGASASHTLVTLDGHRLSAPQLGQLDPTLLPAVVLERAEVMHGPASALYGTDAVGGVVALRTPQAAAPTARLRLGVGAFGERTVSGLIAGPLEIGAPPLTLTVAADAARSQGDYSYVDSTAFNPETRTSGVARPRRNTDVERDALFGRLGLRTGSHEASAGLLLTDAARGLFDYAAAQAARQHDRALRLWADHTVHFDAARVVTDASLQRAALRYRNPALGVDDEGRTQILSLQGRVERAVSVGGGTWTGTLGGSVGRGRANHPGLVEAARETSSAAFASLVMDHPHWLVSGSLRFDRTAASSVDSSGAVQALSPRLGVSLQPTAWSGLRLKASAGRAFRTPTFNDRFWSPGGNPDLRPERGWTAEAGASVQHAPGRTRLTAEATAFTSRLDDRIVWRFGRFADGSYWAPVNVGRVRTTGWEVSASARLGLSALGDEAAFAEVGGLWARSLARDRSDPGSTAFGQSLLYVPDDQGKAYLALGWRALRLDVQVRHAGRRLTQSDGGASLPPYTVADGRLSAGLGGAAWRGRLALRLDNLTDANYAVTPRFPMPPRHLRLALTLSTR